MLKIRRYKDIDFVDYVATLEKTSKWGKKAGEQLKTRLDRMTRREQAWIGEINSRAVGFMILVPNKDGSLEIDWLDVHPNFQRMGVGTSLVEKAVKVARSKKLDPLSVHTWEKNEEMIGFASKNGFEVFERIKDFYGKRKDALRLVKRIPSQEAQEAGL
jgi:ribosomal protein S18 acetylase RimI-like enzyme